MWPRFCQVYLEPALYVSRRLRFDNARCRSHSKAAGAASRRPFTFIGINHARSHSVHEHTTWNKQQEQQHPFTLTFSRARETHAIYSSVCSHNRNDHCWQFSRCYKPAWLHTTDTYTQLGHECMQPVEDGDTHTPAAHYTHDSEGKWRHLLQHTHTHTRLS